MSEITTMLFWIIEITVVCIFLIIGYFLADTLTNIKMGGKNYFLIFNLIAVFMLSFIIITCLVTNFFFPSPKIKVVIILPTFFIVAVNNTYALMLYLFDKKYKNKEN
jgi:hypothetical protein